MLFIISTIYIDGYSQVIQNQQFGRFRICKGKVRDSEKGKTSGHYDHNEKIIMVLSMPGAKSITLSFKSFCTEKDNDVLKIYDGKDTNSTLLGTYSGSSNPGNITSTDSFITLYFTSDKSVSCTGWEADVLNNIGTPDAVKINLNKSPVCSDSIIDFTTNFAVYCDSISSFNTQINGAVIQSIVALNCTNKYATKFRISLKNPLLTNGTFTISHKHGYRDYCDSVYILSSSQTFNITNCPILVDLNSNKDTICLGECIQLKSTASGGNSAKYNYLWNIAGLSGSSPSLICPKVTTKYKITVSDGNAIPGVDSIIITVLQPPQAPKDTQICYLSPNIFLKGQPLGGKWYGSGIVNANTGEFKPYGQWGNVKIWYKIGGCADTMIVNVTNPYNYDNVFCPGKTPLSVIWYGPIGGTWTGPKISSNGFFLPDSAGTYVVTYTWKGCTSKKNILVQSVTVPTVDTTCESRTLDTLQFKPYGIYPQYFTGLTNTYYGWFNPSLMGGPGTRNIIFTAIGGCKDTTKLTILPCYAGKDDTICPNVQNHSLLNTRFSKSYTWKGKGIVNPSSNIYDASWSNGINAIDTLKFFSGRCVDTKIIRVIGTAILSKDTLDFCYNSDTLSLDKTIKTNVPNGTWSGVGVIGGRKFAPKNMSPGLYLITYAKNGCQDQVILRVLNKPKVQNDTSVCEDSQPFELIASEKGGVFWGTGVKYGVKTEFSPILSTVGMFKINYLSPLGCSNTFNIEVDSLVPIQYLHPTKTFCFKDSPILLNMNPLGGMFEISNKSGKTVDFGSLSPGKFSLKYRVSSRSCVSLDSFDIVILDSVKLSLSPNSDSVCKGESVILQANALGGTGNYQFSWSNGQNGYKIFASPSTTTSFTCSVNDACSNIEKQQVKIVVHPSVWTKVKTNLPVCYGRNGYAILHSGSGNPYLYNWTYPMEVKNDTFFAPSGGQYKVLVTDSITKCFSDTTIYFPGFPAVKALFGIQKPIKSPCYTPEENPITIFNATVGASRGHWILNNEIIDTFTFGKNLTLTIPLNASNKHNFKLVVENGGRCRDTSEVNLCFKDTILLYIPTAFSPNGDGLNDDFEWNNFGATKIKVRIFNRWGEIIHESTDLKGSWNGQLNGVPCPEGLYIAYIEYRGSRVANKVFSQSFLLLRNIDK